MKDREFLLLVCLVSLTLIFFNFSLFLKSIASSSFLQPPLKQAAQPRSHHVAVRALLI